MMNAVNYWRYEPLPVYIGPQNEKKTLKKWCTMGTSHHDRSIPEEISGTIMGIIEGNSNSLWFFKRREDGELYDVLNIVGAFIMANGPPREAILYAKSFISNN